MIKFADYVDAFNSGDDDGLVDQWFTEDFRFIGGNRSIEGREAWRKFLHGVHDGLREIFRPITTFDSPTGHFCEIDMDFHAIKPQPNFPFGPLAPGDMYTVKFFVIYEKDGDRFRELRSSTWPTNVGTSKLPRLGAHVTQRAGFEALRGALGFEDGDNARQYLADTVRTDAGGDPVAVMRDIGLVGAELAEANDKALLVQVAGGQYRLELSGGLISGIARA